MHSLSPRDIPVILGDFNAVTGYARVPGEISLDPYGSGSPNENSDLLLSFARRHHLRIAGTWFPHKDIHRRSWYSNDGVTKKEIDHILIGTRFKAVSDCRVFRGFEFNSDHRIVIARIGLHLARARANPNNKKCHFDPTNPNDLQAMAQHWASNAPSEDMEASVEVRWGAIKHTMFSATKNRPLSFTAKKPWISTESLNIIAKRRSERLAGNWANYHALDGPRRRSLRHDRRCWAEKLALEGETLLQSNNLAGAYKRFKLIKSKPQPLYFPVADNTGLLVTNSEKKLELWAEHFRVLLNPNGPVPQTVEQLDLTGATQNDSPSLAEISKALNKLKPGKAPGVCGISVEMLKAAGPPCLQALQQLFTEIWRTGVVPKDWKVAIILPLYKGKGDKSARQNYRGISLLSIPGKLFAKVLLFRLRPYLIGTRRREQSGFTESRSTVDRVLALSVLAQTRREYEKALYAAYVDLKAAFDSVNREALWESMRRLGVPPSLLALIKSLHSETWSCVRSEGIVSHSFQTTSGVRQGCVLAPDLFNIAMDQVMNQVSVVPELGATLDQLRFTDFDFADDVVLLAEHVHVFTSALATFEASASTLGLHINWNKTKIQSLNDGYPCPIELGVGSQVVECVTSFNYLGCTMSSSCSSEEDVLRKLAIARNAFGELKKSFWCCKINLQTKVRLFDAYILPILLYGSETWTCTIQLQNKVNAFGTNCLRYLCGVKWSDFVPNEEIYRRCNHRDLVSLIKKRQLGLFGHIMRFPATSDVRQIVSTYPIPTWKKPPGRPRLTWRKRLTENLRDLSMSFDDAVALTADRVGWRKITS